MPRFAANLSMLFHEVPFLDRFERAVRAGFEAVEFQFPYAFEAREIEYAQVLGVGQLNALAGKAPQGASEEVLYATFVSNLRHAAAALKAAGLRLLIEPINSFDVPGYFLTRSAQALQVLDEVGADNAYLQYDAYHAHRMEGDLAATIERQLARIGHIQIADHPGRDEPGTGEIDHARLFAQLDRIGYAGWVGCEYIPAAGTEAGLGWREQLAPAHG